MRCLKESYDEWEIFPNILKTHNRVYKLKKRPNINQYLEDKVNLLKKTNDFYKINESV